MIAVAAANYYTVCGLFTAKVTHELTDLHFVYVPREDMNFFTHAR